MQHANDELLTKIADKIGNLANLTVANGATEAEAASAAAHISRLLTKYNLTLAQVSALAAPVDDTAIGREHIANDGTRRFQWEETLAHHVGKGFYCRVLYTKAGYWFVGADRDRATAITIFRRLRDVLSALSSDATKIYSAAMSDAGYAPRELRGVRSLKSYKLSWLLGAAAGVGHKLAEARQQDTVEYGNAVTALVVSNDVQLTAYVNEVWPKMSKGRASSASFNNSAYAAGVTTGYRQSLARADLED